MEVLNSILQEYAKKKLKAEMDAEKRKEELYENVPKLKEIEDNLNSFAINTAKNILKYTEKLNHYQINKLYAVGGRYFLIFTIAEQYTKVYRYGS